MKREPKHRGRIASRGIIHIPQKFKKTLGLTDHKQILFSIEGNKLIIELEPQKDIDQELELKKKDVINFIDHFNLKPKEDLSAEEFLNESRRY